MWWHLPSPKFGAKMENTQIMTSKFPANQLSGKSIMLTLLFGIGCTKNIVDNNYKNGNNTVITKLYPKKNIKVVTTIEHLVYNSKYTLKARPTAIRVLVAAYKNKKLCFSKKLHQHFSIDSKYPVRHSKQWSYQMQGINQRIEQLTPVIMKACH